MTLGLNNEVSLAGTRLLTDESLSHKRDRKQLGEWGTKSGRQYELLVIYVQSTCARNLNLGMGWPQGHLTGFVREDPDW